MSLLRSQLPDTPVFDDVEREVLAPALVPFAAITRNHLFGLFVALGEYAVRVGEDGSPTVLNREPDPAWLAAHRALLTFEWQHGRFRHPDATGELFFTPEEREILRLRKYVHAEHLTKGEIVELLEAVSAFSLTGTLATQIFGWASGIVRLIHAHNAFISFRNRPFTEQEFNASCTAVLAGQPSTLQP